MLPGLLADACPLSWVTGCAGAPGDFLDAGFAADFATIALYEAAGAGPLCP